MSARYVYAILALLFLTGGYACWCRAPLIWDGAYQFDATLIMQRPFFYLTRFHTWFLWWPAVWASNVTGNTLLLQAIYGLPFLLAPFFAIALSWWMVHKHAPHLILWPLFGVAAGTLPGQIFVINDSIFQQSLFWPIFMGMLVPLSIPKKIVIGVLVIFQFVHPLGMLLFLGTAVALAFVAMKSAFMSGNAESEVLTRLGSPGEEPKSSEYLRLGVSGSGAIGKSLPDRDTLIFRSAIMAALFLLCAGKIYITSKIPALWDGYAMEEAAWHTARDRWSAGVRGFPLDGLFFMWAAAIMFHLFPRWKRQLTRRHLKWIGALSFIAAGIIAWENRRMPGQSIIPADACAMFVVFLLLMGGRLKLATQIGSITLIVSAIWAIAWLCAYRDDPLGLWLALAAGALWRVFLYSMRTHDGTRRFARLMPIIAILCAMACWLWWAHDGHLWWKAIDYRRWVGPLTAPFFILAMLEAAERGKTPAAQLPETVKQSRSIRQPMALLLACTFALVFGLQCAVWNHLVARLIGVVRNSPAIIVPERDAPWTAETPLDHWATGDVVMADQGKEPAHLFLDPMHEEFIYGDPGKHIAPKVPHWNFYPNPPDPTPGPAGWYNLKPLLSRLEKEPRPAMLSGPKRLDAKMTPD